jgi:hypothetical protein
MTGESFSRHDTVDDLKTGGDMVLCSEAVMEAAGDDPAPSASASPFSRPDAACPRRSTP